MHTDHDHKNIAIQFQLRIDGWGGAVLDTWAEAAAEAVRTGVGRWVDRGQSSIYLKDGVSIHRVQRKP